MQWLSDLWTGDYRFSQIAVLAACGIAVLVALAIIYRVVFAHRLRVPGGRTRQPRLGLVDAFSLDGQRQLVLVRRDNVEHLVMIGGPNDVLLESQINRAATTPRENGLAASGPAAPARRRGETAAVTPQTAAQPPVAAEAPPSGAARGRHRRNACDSAASRRGPGALRAPTAAAGRAGRGADAGRPGRPGRSDRAGGRGDGGGCARRRHSLGADAGPSDDASSDRAARPDDRLPSARKGAAARRAFRSAAFGGRGTPSRRDGPPCGRLHGPSDPRVAASAAQSGCGAEDGAGGSDGQGRAGAVSEPYRPRAHRAPKPVPRQVPLGAAPGTAPWPAADHAPAAGPPPASTDARSYGSRAEAPGPAPHPEPKPEQRVEPKAEPRTDARPPTPPPGANAPTSSHRPAAAAPAPQPVEKPHAAADDPFAGLDSLEAEMAKLLGREKRS